MNRIMLNLSEEELRQADELAKKQAVSRAEIFRQALAMLQEAARRQAEEEERKARLREIFAHMDEAAKELAKDPDWDPIAITRAWRDRHRKP